MPLDDLLFDRIAGSIAVGSIALPLHDGPTRSGLQHPNLFSPGTTHSLGFDKRHGSPAAQ